MRSDSVRVDVQNCVLEQQLGEQEQFYIPINLTKTLVQFKKSDGKVYCRPINVLQLMQYPHNQSVEIMLENNRLIVMEIFKKHKTYVILKPPLVIKNCIQQNIQIRLNDKPVNLVQNQIYESNQFDQKEKVKLALVLDKKVYGDEKNNPDKSCSEQLLNGDEIQHYNENNKCQKIRYNENTFFSVQYGSVEKQRNLIIYQEGIIYNNSNLELKIKGRCNRGFYSKGFNELYRYKNQYYFDEQDIIVFQYKEQKHSQKVNISLVQNQKVELDLEDNKQIELGINIQMQSIENEQFIMYKQIKINPRYVLVNNSVNTIEYRQSYQIISYQLESDSRKPVVWSNKNGNKSIQLKINKYDWSSQLYIEKKMQEVIEISGDGMEGVYLWVDVRQDEDIIFIILRTSDEVGPGYLIDNRLSSIDINVKQKNMYKEMKEIKRNQQQEFGWVDLTQDQKEIEIEILQEIVSVCPDQINSIIERYIDDTRIIIYIELNGITKQIVVREEEEYRQQMIKQNDENSVITQIGANIAQLGISIIDNINIENTYELFYIYFKKIEYCMIEKIKDKTNQLRIQYMNLDHNKYYYCQYPVILTSCYNQQIMEKQQKYTLNICVQQQKQNSNSFIQMFDFIRIDVQSFVLRVEYFLINNIIQFYTSIKEIEKESLLNRQQDGNIGHLDSNVINWQMTKLPIQKTQRSIKELTISPFKLQFSFQFNKKTDQQVKNDGVKENGQKSIGQQFSQQIMSKMENFIIITNIEDGKLEFNGIGLKNILDSNQWLMNTLVNHYKDNLSYQLLNVLGSLDLIGNPIGLISNVGIGVKDAIVKPIEGFVDGPLEMGKGFIQGTNSFVSNTVGGTFSSINKISKSMAQGMSTLAMDNEFLQQREQLRQKKAKGISDSLQQASLGLFQVFEQSMTGLVTKPIQGAKEKGVTGLIEGSAKSMLGIVLNPITGIFDAISKTAEGIQNEFINQDELPNQRRQRPIRAFYSFIRRFKQYSQEQAQVVQILHKFKNGKYSKQIYFDSFFIKKGSHVIMIFMSETLLCIDLKQKCKVWSIEVQNISTVDQQYNGVLLYLNQLVKVGDMKLKSVDINISDRDLIKKTADNILYLQEILKENQQLE